ncbi:MAG: DNA polymerase III subunit delta [Patescibacteria group bacterium]
MIKLIYGQDTYRSKKKLSEILAEFLVSDPNKMNLEQIDGAEMAYGDFDRAISTMPFLAEKRLVIITNFLTKNKDSDLKSKIADRIGKISDQVDIIFFESGDPDKRVSLFKKLSADAENFAPLVGSDIDKFILENIKKSGMEIDFQAVRLLSSGLSADLNRLENELQKLILYAKSQGRKKIIEADVLELVEMDNNANVFHFVEALSGKNQKMAPQHLYNLIKIGEPEIKILSMIVYQYRNMIILKDFIESGEAVAGLASKAKMHPFVVQKTLPILKKYSLAQLIGVYSYLQKIDSEIKTGEIEPRIAIDMIVAKLAM